MTMIGELKRELRVSGRKYDHKSGRIAVSLADETDGVGRGGRGRGREEERERVRMRKPCRTGFTPGEGPF